MKKLMKKKVSLLGKEFSVFAIVMVAMIGLASAALVPYLSNALTTTIGVDSPIAIDGFEATMSAYGGETEILSATLVNQADAQIKGKIQIVITNTGMTLDDFTSLTASIKEYIGTDPTPVFSADDVDLTTTGAFVGSVDADTNTITITTLERTFEIDETWDAEIAVGFKANALGDYTVNVTVIPTVMP